MFLSVFVATIATLLVATDAVQTTTERRVHKHKHSTAADPLQSLSQLLQKSAELTKAFEKQATALREKVQESEVPESSAEETVDESPSFLEVDGSKPVQAGAGLKAMEAVTEEIMRYTDKMRKMGNEASMFSRR